MKSEVLVDKDELYGLLMELVLRPSSMDVTNRALKMIDTIFVSTSPDKKLP